MPTQNKALASETTAMSTINTADYANKPEPYFALDRSEMIEFVPQCARLLEVGCGDGRFMSALKRERKLFAVGVEPYPTASNAAADVFDQLLACSIDEAIQKLADQRFDCIVCNDVLEHLMDPWQVLKSFRRLLAPGGRVVASIPNVRYFPVLQDLVFSRNWEYRDYGVLDRTHVRFFTSKSIANAFKSCGYVVDRLEGINPCWVSWKWKVLNAVSRGGLADTRYQQFACVASAAQ